MQEQKSSILNYLFGGNMIAPNNLQKAAHLKTDVPRPCNQAIFAGQFVVGKDQVVLTWDHGMELLTGIEAEKVVGFKLANAPSGESPWLASYFLDHNFQKAQKDYGPSKVFRLPMAGEWLGTKNLTDPWGQTIQITELVTRQTTSQAIIQTVLCPDPNCRENPCEREELDSIRILAEHVPAGVALMQDGKLVFVNQTFCTMFGYSTPDELTNKPSKQLLVEEDRNRHTTVLSNLEKNHDSKYRFQWTGIGRNGRKFWFEGRPVPIEWQGKSAVLSFVMDITEFKQREELMAKESHQLRVENTRLKTSIDHRVRLGNIIGKSAKMQEVFEAIVRAASSDFSVVIYGETGTGKELVAQAIHELSQRNENSFVPVNCGAIPDELFESEFFGHKKGSFTGAYNNKTGLLDQAKGGTLFLDEIGELNLSCQVKLLRALGSGEYTAIGSSQTTKAKFSLVAATNANLEEMVKKGDFRQDLFFRIHVIPVYLPPLRERKEDIPYLVEHILKKLGSDQKIPSKDLAILLDYNWPGNVRELHNILERYVAFGHLDFLEVNRDSKSIDNPCGEFDFENNSGDLRLTLMAFERKLILKALKKHSWNRSRTAKYLGLPRKTLFRKIQKLSITSEADKD